MSITRSLRLFPALVVVLLFLAFTLAPRVSAQGPEQFREVEGKVVDAQRRPVKGAVVHIENEASELILSYVTDGDGYFHFKRVSANDNFKVWAMANGVMSKKHSLSRFNSKEEAFITLEIR